MVIDVILDVEEDMEKYGGLVVFDDDEGESKLVDYSPEIVYRQIEEYNDETHWLDDILKAFDSGTNADIQRELSRYVVDSDYSSNVIDFIKSFNWLQNYED